MTNKQTVTPAHIAACIMMGCSLLFIILYGLLAALLSGLFVYSLVHLMAPRLESHFSSRRAKMVAVAGLASLVVGALTLGIWAAILFFQSDAGNLQNLLQRLADMLEASRQQIPDWLRQTIPEDAASLRELITSWLRTHADEAKLIGERAGRAAAHVLIGMIIGAMAALHDTGHPVTYLPLAAALRERLARLSDAFQRIVFAQIRIAGINALLTGLYLMVVLPLFGVHLPMVKTLVLLTFVFGLLPVVGNLFSNAVLVLVGLTHSFDVALWSLLFLVTIHKMEYFLNARIIGHHIQASAWELLVAMLTMEAAFGLYGVVAAPVFYAYIKIELIAHRLV